MMRVNNWRVDLVKLSSEEKPTGQIDGTTLYEVDTSKFFIYYKGQWYEQTSNITREG